ncbi:MAG: dihydropteroate synthase [Deltaproteobacteria bacterium]|nr:dihydropteroate synthase [Deltaproteobacteria bacterium]
MSRPHFDWAVAKKIVSLDRRTLIMGVLNTTPDSFYDHGRYNASSAAIAQAHKLAREGADIIDIGGESTRPDSDGVPAEAELARVIPVIEAVASSFAGPISIDTTKAEVAKAALAAGASIINDISGLSRDPGMIPLAAESGCGVVLMHMRGRPKNMQSLTDYDDPVADVKAELAERLAGVLAGGVRPQAIVLDPGLGFAKTAEQNLEIMRRLDEFLDLKRPLLLGPSRKSFVGRALAAQGLADQPDERLFGGVAAVALAAFKGASIVRVHDVAVARQALAVADAVREGSFVC